MEAKFGTILSVNRSDNKGEKKVGIGEAYLEKGFGLENDAHGGPWHRQVSLLSLASVEKMRALGCEIAFGDFAENLTVEGIDLPSLPIGTQLRAGESLLEVTQIGKECHKGCAIMQQVGHCVMPKEGIFARVLDSGWVRIGDKVEILESNA